MTSPKKTNDVTVKQELEATFKCNLCKDGIRMGLSDFRLHYKSAHRDKRLPRRALASFARRTCDICGRNCMGLKSLKKHVEATHTNQFDCEICNVDYSNVFFYIKHLRVHSEKRIFKCVYCEYSTANLGDIAPHLRGAHEGKYKYTCAICNQGFHLLEWFEEHGNYHSGAKPFRCEFCDKSFLYSRHLSCHRRRLHKEMMSYECKICKRKYDSRANLKLHMVIHNRPTRNEATRVLCEICGKEMTNTNTLNLHRRIHTGDKPFSCRACGKTFTRKERLKEHVRIHTGEKPFVCRFCGRGFAQRPPLRVHERTHTGERPYACRFCQKGFVSKGVMDVHMKNCEGLFEFKPIVLFGVDDGDGSEQAREEFGPTFDCYLCKDGIKMSLPDFKLHYKAAHRGKRLPRRARSPFAQHTCDICAKTFGSAFHLSNHLLRHDEKFICEICDNGFKHVLYYVLHMRTHCKTEIYNCVYCEYSTTSTDEITAHMGGHEGKFKYKCDICFKGFHILEWFKEHSDNYHDRIKPFACEFCGKSFIYSRHLSFHKKIIHKEMRTYECNICKKKIAKQRCLVAHMAIHNGKNKNKLPVLCDICGKEMTNKHSLTLHLRIHTGVKPYACDFCDKSFTRRERLKEHERTHTGEKPFVCRFCGKGFTQRASLRIHERTHTGERPYVCRFCNKGFISKGPMDMHMQNCQG